MRRPMDQVIPLTPDMVIPGDPTATLWKLCVANKWGFAPGFGGEEPLIDPRCAAHILAPEKQYKTAQNNILNGVRRYPGGLVKLSEVMANQDAGDVTKAM